MVSLFTCARPLLHRLDAETAHNLTLAALRTGLVPAARALRNPALEVTLWDRKFPNPLGLAAGFDKNAAVVGALFKFGFGFVEAGTVTPQPQTGNPKPRVFRDADHGAVINAMGFPNLGVDAFKANITRFLERRPRPTGLIGINIGMNKGQAEPVKDYRLLVRSLGPLADYLTVNISSPNTPGLRDLQARENLLPLLAGIIEERARSCGAAPPPVLVKLAPDLDAAQRESVAGALLEAGIDGVILTNTTLARPADLPPAFAAHKGGLSGRPLRDRSTAAIAAFYRLTGGKLPIVGAGGIASAADAWDKIRAGASLLQLYSGLVFGGPDMVENINKGLLERVRQAGLSRIGDAVGTGSRGAA